MSDYSPADFRAMMGNYGYNGCGDGMFGFGTLVQVDEDNNPCDCSKTPTTIQVLNTVAALYNKVNIVITKIC